MAAFDDQVYTQAANVATLPGIVGASHCMPDAHWGYGFPIGGVAATDAETGVISPGGIGFDINCGMRLVRSDLTWAEVQPLLRRLIDALAARVPAGVGQRGFVDLSAAQFSDVLREGARWAVAHGFGTQRDLDFTESRGCFLGADPECVSQAGGRARPEPARHPGLGQPLPGDPGRPCGRRARRGARRDLRPGSARTSRGHVPLRQPRLRAPGGDRLPGPLPARDADQVRACDRGPRACLRAVPLRRRSKPTSRRCAARRTWPSPIAR